MCDDDVKWHNKLRNDKSTWQMTSGTVQKKQRRARNKANTKNWNHEMRLLNTSRQTFLTHHFIDCRIYSVLLSYNVFIPIVRLISFNAIPCISVLSLYLACFLLADVLHCSTSCRLLAFFLLIFFSQHFWSYATSSANIHIPFVAIKMKHESFLFPPHDFHP